MTDSNNPRSKPSAKWLWYVVLAIVLMQLVAFGLWIVAVLAAVMLPVAFELSTWITYWRTQSVIKRIEAVRGYCTVKSGKLVDISSC